MRTRLTIDDVLSPRAAVARRWFEVPVMVAALAVLPVMFLEQIALNGWLNVFAQTLNWLIWAAFAVEFTVVASSR